MIITSLVAGSSQARCHSSYPTNSVDVLKDITKAKQKNARELNNKGLNTKLTQSVFV